MSSGDSHLQPSGLPSEVHPSDEVRDLPTRVLNSVHARHCVTLLAIAVGVFAAAGSGAQEADTLSEEQVQAETLDEETWLDSGYDYVDERAHNLAEWVDSFFGHPRDVADEARSIIRIRPQFEWDEEDDTDWKLRATGRLYLPRTSDRLSVVFSGEDGDFDEEFYDPTMPTGDSAGGIQYQVRRERRSSAYLFAGMKAGPKAKLGARYRYHAPLPMIENTRWRASEEVFWVGGDGFTSLTRFDIDHALAENKLLRWANRVEIGEETEGWEWRTRLSWIRRYGDRTAFRVFGDIRGETDPELLKSRGFGMGLRRNFLRDWLYWEIEPRYDWRKRRPEEDREGVASVRLRLEAIIGEN